MVRESGKEALVDTMTRASTNTATRSDPIGRKATIAGLAQVARGIGLAALALAVLSGCPALHFASLVSSVRRHTVGLLASTTAVQ